MTTVAGPAGSAAASHRVQAEPLARPARRAVRPATMPGMLHWILAALVGVSLLWGTVAAWSVAQRAAAAGQAVTAIEPLRAADGVTA